MKKKSPRDKAWEWFSKMYRLKHCDEYGYLVCYTCGTKLFWNQGMQVGHLLDGRYNSIIFMEECVRNQCYGCNCGKSGNKEVYIPKFIDEMGREFYDSLVKLKWVTKKYSKRELEEMKQVFKFKAREYAEHKGLNI